MELLGQVAAQGAFEAQCVQREAGVLSQLLAAEGARLAALAPDAMRKHRILVRQGTASPLNKLALPALLLLALRLADSVVALLHLLSRRFVLVRAGRGRGQQ